MTTSTRTTATMMSGILLAACSIWAGHLTPPGAPGSTMKPLSQVEPRIPISSAPFTISQSGSYYLTTNLFSLGYGVVITASDFTLDLMGCALRGNASTEEGGVWVRGTSNNVIQNVVVRNGMVRGFRHGVRVDFCQGSRFEQLVIASNNRNGIYFYGPCDDNTIVDCTIHGNGDYGILLYSYAGHCNGNAIANCTIVGNGEGGIYL